MKNPSPPRSVRLAALCAVLLIWASSGHSGTLADPPQARSGLAGEWQGTLDAGATKLRLILHLADSPDGGLTATLDSPDQGSRGLRVDEVRVESGHFSLVLRGQGATFEAVLQEGGSKLAGQWKQRGASLHLTFERTTASAQPIVRTQEPRAPLPYDVEEVSYENRSASVRLAGTLTTPRGVGPFPAVVLITGSGPEDRDETIFGHKPFLVLADHLTRHGVAVLRSDDRGVGGSEAGAPGATSMDFASDAEAAVSWLASRKGIDVSRIGLLGHSEGGIIAGIAAARSSSIAFVVGLASPSLRGDKLLLLQSEALLRGAGAGPEAIAAARKVNEMVYAAAASEADPARRESRVREAMTSAGLSGPALDQQLAVVLSPWFYFFLTHDPSDSLSRIEVPVLLLYGERDRQVPAEPNAAAGRTALARVSQSKTEILSGLNHLFQECQTGNIDEYARIEQTLAPAALERVSAWILATAAPTASVKRNP